MTTISIRIISTQQHLLLEKANLLDIERTSTAFLLRFAGPDHEVTIELPKETGDIFKSALNLLEIYPSIRHVST